MKPFPTTLAACLAVLAATTGASAEADYLTRFEGQFSGSGTVQRDVDPQPRRVSCQVNGTLPSETELDISGSCRAAVVFTRQIGAQIRYDPSSESFSGVYIGGATGPAQLSGGRLSGDTLTMTLTYPAPVFGDSTATMTIRAGSNGFSFTVTDQVNGENVSTTDIQLSSR
ncbi:hypothetical protein [Aureimonas mangrovi]|uniref:hypothetical protein n=1 Tax=Aureimonas mangrovi TaxID=2758041 RepID=UPI00163DD8D8|nr:hypothetical protein [Aureimonas mangrovi]